MALSDAEIESIIRRHDDRWDTLHLELGRYRDAYEDRFWEKDTSGLGEWRSKVEVNRMRPWAISYVSSLFYKGMRSVVEADDVIRNKPSDGDPVRGPDPSPIQSIIDRFYKLESVKATAKQAVEVALMYPHCAIRLGIDRSILHPVDQIYLDFVPPWACIWDTKATTRRNMRYIGFCDWVPIEQVALEYGLNKADLVAEIRPDPIEDGLKAARPREPDDEEGYVRVLEFYDLTCWTKIEGMLVQGEKKVFLFNQAYDSSTSNCLDEIFSGPCPFVWPDGTPAPPIVPIVLAHLPEKPLHGIASAATVYELSRELNQVSTYLAQAFRKDAGRVWLMLKSFFDEETLDKFESGEDHIIAQIEGDRLEGIVKALEGQPLAPSVMAYRQVLEQGMEQVQGTSPASRGTPTKYVSATESQRLTDYTETTLGMFKEGMDSAFAECGSLYLRVLHAAMEDAGLEEIQVRIMGEVQTVTLDNLDHRWRVDLVDSANTPMKEAQKRMELQETLKPLIELATLATSDQSKPALQMLAQKLQMLMVKLYDLPEDMNFSRLAQDAPSPPSMPAGIDPALLAQPPSGMASPMPSMPMGEQGPVATTPAVPTPLDMEAMNQEAPMVPETPLPAS